MRRPTERNPIALSALVLAAVLAAGPALGGERCSDGKKLIFDEVRELQMDLVVRPEMKSETPHTLHLQSRSFRPEPGIDRGLYDTPGDTVVAIAQRRSFPEDRDWQALEAAGAEAVSYLGELSWVLRVRLGGQGAADALGTVAESFGAKALAPLTAADRLDPGLLDDERDEGYYDPDTGLLTVAVRFFPGTAAETVDGVIAAHHRGHGSPKQDTELFVQLEVAPESVEALASVPEVQRVDRGERFPYPTLDLARDLVNVETVQGIDIVPLPPSYQLSGRNVLMSNNEGIGSGTHEDFWNHDAAGNPTTGRWCPGAWTGGGDHGVMTGGLMLGNGWRSQANGGAPYQWRGMAPEAIFCNYSNPPHVANFSFALSPWGQYSSHNASVDARIRGDSGNNRHPHVGAVANQGLKIQYGTELGYYSVYRNAKNELIVGNLRSADAFWNTSSLGPTFDGRIKPDLAAPGSYGSFPRDQAQLDFDLDSIELVSANGNKLWHFDAATSDWHGGWGQGAWTWARHNITTPTQATYGATQAMSFALEAPPWGTAWTNRPLIGTYKEPDAVTQLTHAGLAGDTFELRYRFEADSFWDGSILEIRWFTDWDETNPDWYSQAGMHFNVIADGNWHTATVPVGTHADWAGEPAIEYWTLRFSAPPMLRPANPDHYSGSGGSSAASPMVAGAVALLLEKMVNEFAMALGDTSPSPFWQPAPGSGTALPSTLKALLVHTAADLEWTPAAAPDPPNPDTGAATVYHEGPDYATGYGVIDVQAAVDLLDVEAAAGAGTHVIEEEMGASGVHVYDVTVPFGSEGPLEVTLAWDDYPGDPSAAEVVPKLVNNLDLLVKDPAGNFHFPWSIDLPYVPTSPSQYPSQVEPEPITAADIHPARRDVPNHRDNVEKVEVDCPAHGHWKVYVLASGMGAPPQRYSLVLGKP